jgi:HlyD family secretion protein
MLRKIAPLALGATLLLGACARAEVPVAPTSAAVAPTSSSGFPGALPTVAPISTQAAGQATAIPALPRPTFTVQRGTVESQLDLVGRVVQVQQDLAFLEDGVISSVAVERGAQVEAGQLLAELELGDLQDQLRQAQTIAQQDRIALEQSVQAGTIEVRRATIDLETARGALAQAREAARPEQLARARATLETAKADLATTRNNASAEKNETLRQMNLAVQSLEVARGRLADARARYSADASDSNRAELLAAEDAVRNGESEVSRATIAYDTARGNEVAAVQRAEAAVGAAEAELAALLRLPDPYAVAEAERGVQRAQNALEAARQRAKPDPELQKRVAADDLEVQRIERLIEGRRLYAPLSGQVGYIEVRPGSPARAGTPVMSIVDPSRSEIVAEFDLSSAAGRSATDIVVGQPVTISFARFPGKSFTGEVTRLPGSGADGNPTAVSTYSISFDPAGESIPVGEPAELRVVLGRVENALWLPAEAIRYNRERPFVVVKQGDEERRVDVTLGLSGTERVEIIAGLNENDVVLGEATR